MADLEYQVQYHRAFEAVLWGMPAVSIHRIREGSSEATGIRENEIISFSKPLTTRHEFLTANNTTPYILGYADLRQGPVVVEVPAKTDKASLYGQIVDAWQVTIADLRPSGFDKGQGGNYLLIPPGDKTPIPAGYLPIHSQSHRVLFAFRSIAGPNATAADAYAYSELLKVYPLAEAAKPKPTRFVDGFPNRISTLMFFDIRYFKDLHDIVSVEPIRERDKVMMGMLASIGIEPGKPFDPQGKTKAAMEAAVVDAYHLLKERNIALYKSNAYWPDRHWAFTLITDPARGFEFVTDKAVLIDDRAQVFFMQTMNPKYVSEKPATVYLFAFEDASGRALEPGKTYRLRFPKDVPVGQFWSLIVYDDATGAFIYSPTDRVGLSFV